MRCAAACCVWTSTNSYNITHRRHFVEHSSTKCRAKQIADIILEWAKLLIPPIIGALIASCMVIVVFLNFGLPSAPPERHQYLAENLSPLKELMQEIVEGPITQSMPIPMDSKYENEIKEMQEKLDKIIELLEKDKSVH